GYSDMAIGLGKIFGFHFLENFNYPYISKSITEFWRRWHMSLGTWFRDYVYIPMGGNRVPRLKWIRNIIVVWFLTGFWHGAEWNFIIWGLYFALFLALEKFFLRNLLEKLPSFLGHIYVIFFITISFVIFNANGMGEVMDNLRGMFGLLNIPLCNPETIYYLKSYGLVFIIGFIASTPLAVYIVKKLISIKPCKRLLDILQPLILVILFLVITAYLVDGSFNPFLYFRF
ncbi:MAG: MBOAT family protein, partial [Anaerolineaceae bacterium]